MYVADASVYAYTDYQAGVQKPAYLVRDGGIVLGSDNDDIRVMTFSLIGAYAVFGAIGLAFLALFFLEYLYRHVH